jgi:hypothetical protein
MAGNWPSTEDEARPYGMHRLLSQAVWDADGVRDELRAYVLEQLGDQEGNLAIDETSFPKRGQHASRGPKAVLRDDRARRELSSWRVSGLRQRERICAHRSRTLPSLELDPGS